MTSSWEPIRLADIAPLTIGPLHIGPSTLELRNGPERTMIEPRMMQVLVVLAQAQGTTVSRDELVARCWGGVIVGDNALQRVISRLRDLAQTIGQNVFTIETVKRVGYRLVEFPSLPAAAGEPSAPALAAQPAAGAMPAPAHPPHRRPLRWWAPALIGAAGLALGLWLLITPAAPTSAIIQIELDPGTSSAREAALTLELMRARRTPDLPLFRADGAVDDADFRLQAAPGPAGEATDLFSLHDRRGGVLWSTSLLRAPPGAQLKAMTGAAGAVLFCAFGAGGLDRPYDPEALRLMLALCAQQRIDGKLPDQQQLDQLAGLMPKSPRVAAWQVLRAIDWYRFSQLTGGHDNRAGLERQVARLRRLSPGHPMVVIGENALLPAGRWGQRLNRIDTALQQQPGSAALHEARAALLREIGELGSAVYAAGNALRLDPYDVQLHHALISALGFSGFIAPARKAAGEAELLWPGSAALRDARFRIEWRLGDAATVLRQLEAGDYFGSGPREVQNSLFRNYLLARMEPTPARIEAALAPLRRQWAREPKIPFLLLQAAASLGARDEALAIMQHPTAIAELRTGPEILFRSYLQDLRQDPRFMRAMADIGLAQFWLQRRDWPDFCSAPDLPYECRALTLEILARR